MSKGQSAEDIRARMQQIDPYEFENFVAEVWDGRGWETEVSQGSNDMGVDVVAKKSDGLMEQKAVIQAKRYADGNKVGRPKIQQYHALKQQDADADAAVVVTTSEFTRGAEEWAEEHNVKLIDGDQLVEIVADQGRYDLIDEYAPSADELQEPTSSPSESTTSASSDSESAKDSDYFGFVSMAFLMQVGGWGLVFFPEAIPAISTGIAAGAAALGLLAQPVTVFADAHDLHSRGAEYNPNRLVWPAVAFLLPVLGVLLYIKKRM